MGQLGINTVSLVGFIGQAENSRKMHLSSLISLLILATLVAAKPPPAPKGYRWVKQHQLSDEFNGNKLNTKKWRNGLEYWQGREPARFMPNTVSVKNGNLVIRNNVLNPPIGNYTIAGGGIQSHQFLAGYGYYEARFRASRIMMSTTFWMQSNWQDLKSTSCPKDRYALELDIAESIGRAAPSFNGTELWADNMVSHTHYKYQGCNTDKKNWVSRAQRTPLNSKAYAKFHTYGAWWRDGNQVTFYADDKKGKTMNLRNNINRNQPFDQKMRINMVTETYDFATPYPTKRELRNWRISTSYYDWVRAWRLVKA